MPTAIDAAAQVRWLDDAQLMHALDEIPTRPMLVGDAGLRLSLAGAQDKLPVVSDGARIGLPLFGTPSTHILKPAIAGVEASVLNEGFCMALAAALGLTVAPTRIAVVGARYYLLVERYDRVRLGAQAHLQRLHQEDFCQALGIPPELKYQNEGGPAMAQAFELVRSATRPSAPHVLALLDYVIFNALIGNHDAHAKNFSLLYTASGCRLAPLYDALSTVVYPHLSDKMAMKLGSKYKFTEMLARHWDRFATEAGLSPAQTKKRVLQIAARLPKLAQANQATFTAQGHGHALLSDIVALIAKRCNLVTARIGATASA